MSIPRATLGPLEVSALALGTWRTFERMPRERAVATLRHARELGITFLDEARYDDETGSAPIASGYSEVLLGGLFFEAGFARGGGVVVSEKLWWQFWPEQSAAAELAESLERLRFDSVELIYAVHLPEGLEVARAVDEIAGILAAGEAQAWGVANWTAEQIEQALSACAAAGIDPPCAAQLPYSLVRRDWAGEQRMLDALRAGGTGLVASAVLEGGLLSGRYAQPGATGRLAGAHEDPAHARSLEVGDALVALAREWETTPAALAVAFTLDHPLLACVLVGASAPSQLDELAGAFALHARLGPDERARLAAL